jgi:NTP pyrophosphatase (non-canonical NTP hydrolase)
MKDYFELEACVETWAEEKGIFDKGTPMAQSIKTLEECVELVEAINKNDKSEIIDAMGDIMVTLIIQAKMQNVTLEACLNSAYKVISNRTGKMIDGQFVKDDQSSKD